MAYATYTFFEGELVTVMHEGRRRDVATDPQGSVVHLMTSFFVLSNSLTYWPYGEQRTKSGGINIPFHYIGAHGYYEDTSNRLYVRARYYRADLGNWITKDPLWPEEKAYQYVNGNPINSIDPSGEWVVHVLCAAACLTVGGCAWGLSIACNKWEDAYESFAECAVQYLETLPWYSLAGCGVALPGCLACLAKYAKPLCRKLMDGYCTEAEWNAFKLFIHNPYSCDAKRSCQKIRPPKTLEKCNEAQKRLNCNIACLAARMARQIRCYKSDRNKKNHLDQIADTMSVGAVCVTARKTLNC